MVFELKKYKSLLLKCICEEIKNPITPEELYNFNALSDAVEHVEILSDLIEKENVTTK